MVISASCSVRIFCAAIILLGLCASCPAATILQIRFSELCQRSKLIFEGHVTRVETYQADNTRAIRTVVTFDVIDPIKGENTGDSIQLSFLGGTVGDLTLKIADLRLPELGETGIYFVESLDGQQVNPLTGWAQGHFLVELDSANTKRVLTSNFRPIYSIDPAYEETPKGISTGLALGAHADDNKDLSKALSAESFKNIIKQRLLEPSL